MSRLSRSLRCALCACLVVLSAGVATPAQAWAPAQSGESSGKNEPVNVVLRTKYNQALKATYYQSSRGKDAPVVVLLHMKDGNRFIWQSEGGFANRLHKEGYAVLTVDLRGHGESRGDGAAGAAQGDKKARRELKKGDLVAMYEGDMEAVNKFLLERHQAEEFNMNKTAFVGPEMGATVAVYAAFRDWNKPPYADAPVDSGRQTPRGQNVRALVLISPQQNLQGLGLAQPLKGLGAPLLGISCLVAVAQKDGQDKGQAKKTYDQVASAPGSDQRMYFRDFPGTARGTELLGKKTKLEDTMVNFLGKHLRDLEIPWTDRRPANERE
ncbi:MAG: alpha/beta hydrolase [Planctomycetaceae bacterium]